MARRPYSTVCRFLRDNLEETATIVWYPARPDAGTLGKVSAISSLDWHARPYLVDGVGEVWGEERKYNGKRELSRKVKEPCGNTEDFRRGGLYLPSKPPQEYTPDGLSKCCVKEPAPPLPDGLVLDIHAAVKIELEIEY